MARKRSAPTSEAFFQDIAEHPDDDTPRLVYADWLDDHGQPGRAEYVRAGVALAALDEADPARADWQRRRDAVRREQEELWGAEVGAKLDFRRGLPEHATLKAADFL